MEIKKNIEKMLNIEGEMKLWEEVMVRMGKNL